MTTTTVLRTFASDNYAGVLPEIVAALAEEAQSKSHARSYGNDEITDRTRRLMSEIFSNASLGVHFVFNGTGANVLSILACTQSYHAVICADISHLLCDESSAPETVTGVRMIPIPTDAHGKINLELIEEKLDRLGDMHAAQPKLISIAQPTEYGTVYTIDELKQLSQLAKKYNLYFRQSSLRTIFSETHDPVSRCRWCEIVQCCLIVALRSSRDNHRCRRGHSLSRWNQGKSSS